MTSQYGTSESDPVRRSLAIDGPTAAGKSVVGKGLSSLLSLYFCDTGLMYRAATLAVLESNVDTTDEGAIIKCVQTAGIDIRWEIPEQPLVYLADLDVSASLKSPIIDLNVSAVAGIQEVRDVLVLRQKSVASRAPVVMVGRDIGKVILPEARTKIFLDASLDERARRRTEEMKLSGLEAKFEDIRESISIRDEKDNTGHRSISRDQAASQAFVIDTDGMTLAEVIDECSDIYRTCNGSI